MSLSNTILGQMDIDWVKGGSLSICVSEKPLKKKGLTHWTCLKHELPYERISASFVKIPNIYRCLLISLDLLSHVIREASGSGVLKKFM